MCLKPSLSWHYVENRLKVQCGKRRGLPVRRNTRQAGGNKGDCQVGTSVDLATQALQRLPRGQVVCIGAKQGMGKSEDDKCRAEKSQLNPTVTSFFQQPSTS